MVPDARAVGVRAPPFVTTTISSRATFPSAKARRRAWPIARSLVWNRSESAVFTTLPAASR